MWLFPPGITGPGTVSDDSAPDQRSYWTYEFTWPNWNLWTSHDWMARVWVGGEPGWGVVMSVGEPLGYSVRRIPYGQTTPTPEMLKMSGQELDRAAKAAGPMRVAAGSSKASTKSTVAVKNPFPIAMSSLLDRSSIAPPLVYTQRPGRNPLDELEYYKIFRNGAQIATDIEEPPYDDVVGSANENITYAYYVVAHYDNNQDSPPSNTVNRAANMAPAPPTGLTGEPLGQSQMQLQWTNPTLNNNGQPLVDYAGTRVYRNGELIATVGPGVQNYNDTPPEPDQFYTWTVRGIDEIPNEGPDSEGYTGAVTSPWETCDYEWIDITGNGTSVTLCDDCYEGPFQLGFDFEYFSQTYTEIYICSNGWVSVVMPPWAALDGPCIPDPSEPNGIIAPFWDDLLPSSGQCRYYANAADEQFIISWDQCPHWASGELYTFQIIIGSNGSVTYNYAEIPITTSTVIGVENADGTQGLGVHCQADGPFEPVNQSAVCFWGGPSGEVQGIVRAFGTNAPIEGVTVSITQGPEFTLTDATGFYSLPLDPGTYTVCFAKQGNCDTCYTNILVEDNATTVRNATLRAPQAQFSVTSISEATWPTHDATAVFQITNNGGQCPLDFSITDTSAWLSATPAQGSVPVNGSLEISVLMSVQGLPPGQDYQSALRVQHEAVGSPYVIPVTLTISQSGEQPEGLPTEYALYQNYPNPFNASTSLRFDVPQESHVKIVLFNVMGQAVATVVDAPYRAGRYSVSYEATDLPSGMYLMKLEAGSYTAMKKMLLLK